MKWSFVLSVFILQWHNWIVVGNKNVEKADCWVSLKRSNKHSNQLNEKWKVFEININPDE